MAYPEARLKFSRYLTSLLITSELSNSVPIDMHPEPRKLRDDLVSMLSSYKLSIPEETLSILNHLGLKPRGASPRVRAIAAFLLVDEAMSDPDSPVGCSVGALIPALLADDCLNERPYRLLLSDWLHQILLMMDEAPSHRVGEYENIKPLFVLASSILHLVISHDLLEESIRLVADRQEAESTDAGQPIQPRSTLSATSVFESDDYLSQREDWDDVILACKNRLRLYRKGLSGPLDPEATSR
jgi:hypothetical protein